MGYGYRSIPSPEQYCQVPIPPCDFPCKSCIPLCSTLHSLAWPPLFPRCSSPWLVPVSPVSSLKPERFYLAWSLLWDWGKRKVSWSLISPLAKTCSFLFSVSSLTQQSHHEHGVSESQKTGEGREEGAVQRQMGTCSFQGDQHRRKCTGLLVPLLCCSLLHQVMLQCPEGLDQWGNWS